MILLSASKFALCEISPVHFTHHPLYQKGKTTKAREVVLEKLH